MTNPADLLYIPMSGSEMMEHNPDARLLKYTDLKNYSTIDEAFAHSNKIILLYLTESDSSGHWTGLIRVGKYITFFDSYGMSIDFELNWIPAHKREELGEKYKYLSMLLKKSNYKILHNKFRLQGKKTETCGRHVSLFLLNGERMSIENYVKKYFEGKKESPDLIVCELIN